MPVFERTYVDSSVASGVESGSTSSSILDSFTSGFQTVGEVLGETLEEGGAAAIVNSDPASFATALAQTSISAFNANSANASASNVKTPVRDPIKSALSQQSPTDSNAIITNPTRGTHDSLNIGQTTTSTDQLDAARFSQITALAERFGQSTPTSDADLTSLMKQVTSVAKEANITESFGSIEGTPWLDPENIPVDLDTYDEDIAEFAKFASSQIRATGLGGVQLNEMLATGFTEGLPKLADAFGEAIPNLPIDIDPDMLSMIKSVGKSVLGIATDVMCGNATSYANNQNLFNSLLGLSANQGILCALMGFLSSGRANASSYNILRGQAMGVSTKGMANMVFAISEAVGPGTLGNGLTLAGNLIKKGTIDTYDITAIEDAMDSLSVEAQELFTLEGESFDDSPIWDANRLGAADPATADTLLQDDMSKFVNRSEPVEIETLPWLEQVNIQENGVLPAA